MISLPKCDVGAKMRPLVKVYVKLTNRTLPVARVAKCHNLHAVTSLRRGMKDIIGKCHHVIVFPTQVDVILPKLTEQRHNASDEPSSVVRAFAHGAMGRRIDPSWGGPIELFLVPASVPRLV